jgi:aryl-alcohol dehydrogenase-like predicted oxidoreductase
MSGDMPYRLLGSTKEKVSAVGLGGAHLGTQVDEKESIDIVRTAIDNGINFMDNCWDYNGGESEIRMGKALKDGYRKKVFLMTKVDGRDKKTAQKQIDESLMRLQTDVIDLLQFHEVIRMSDPDRVFAPEGAMEAFRDYQKAGKVRYIGFTGHKSPEIHLRMLQVAEDNGIRFDTVQMPLNVMDAHYKSFEKKVLPTLLRQKIGVLAMKPIGFGLILDSQTVTARECLVYAMSLPVSVVITGCDSLPILRQALETAKTFKPLTNKARSALLAKTKRASLRGEYETYKTLNRFDGTEWNPEWLGSSL